MSIPGWPAHGLVGWDDELEDAVQDYVDNANAALLAGIDLAGMPEVNWNPANNKVLTYNGTSGKVEFQTPSTTKTDLAFAQRTATPQGGFVPGASGALGAVTDITDCVVTITPPYSTTRPLWLRYQFAISQVVAGPGILYAVIRETTTPASGPINDIYHPHQVPNPMQVVASNVTTASGGSTPHTHTTTADDVQTALIVGKTAEDLVVGMFPLGVVTDTTARTFKLGVAVSGISATVPQIYVANGADGNRSMFWAEMH